MIDLDDLEGLCPGLPRESAGPLALRACVALERRHRPGVVLDTTVHGASEREVIRWSKLPATIASTQDDLRVTEEGAIAIALALSARHCGWRVVRCLQSRLGEGADWLMADASERRVVLEVGGTDEGSLGALLSVKAQQARGSIFSRHGRPAACVVRFREPRALLQSDHEPR
ncbi:MAG TPA: hypothetical protein VK932_22435 [Kofleriaceae bacterium]|nr:hypothetical protein [Kofleriaceae bacterium]